MTIGISKDDLLKIDPWQYDNQQDLLNAILDQCAELNPWLPIEQAPKDRFLLVATKANEILVAIYRTEYKKWLYRDWEEVFPTNYQELPADPKGD